MLQSIGTKLARIMTFLRAQKFYTLKLVSLLSNQIDKN